MKTLYVLNCFRKNRSKAAKLAHTSRGIVARCLLVAVLGVLVVPMAMRLETAKAQSTCRFPSSLAVNQILRSANAQRTGNLTWIVAFVLNTSRHIQICDLDYYCPGNPDRYTFKPLISSNVSSLDTGGVGPNDQCRDVWSVTTVNGGSNSFTLGVKVKFQEDVVPGGGTNPKAKTFTLTYPGSVAIGGSIDLTDPSVTITEYADDGS